MVYLAISNLILLVGLAFALQTIILQMEKIEDLEKKLEECSPIKGDKKQLND